MTNLNEKLTNMKKQTIGVEFEMAGITREKACRTAATVLGRPDTARYLGAGGDVSQGCRKEGCYQTWACDDNQGRTWKFMRDSSIQASDAYKTELVTPILRYEDIDTLLEIINKLSKAGAKSYGSLQCGVHIHIGADRHTAKTLTNLVNIMAGHERLLRKASGFYDARAHWCQLTEPDLVKELKEKRPQTTEALRKIWYKANGVAESTNHYNNSRYHMLNLHAFFTKGTVEFRCFNFDEPTAERKHGLHRGQLKAYIQLCLALSNQAKTVSRASSQRAQDDNEKYAMRTWLLKLGFIGDEFKGAREVFNERLNGDAAFRQPEQRAAARA